MIMLTALVLVSKEFGPEEHEGPEYLERRGLSKEKGEMYQRGIYHFVVWPRSSP